MKKVLILLGSPRKGGNSDTLCDEFIKNVLTWSASRRSFFMTGARL